MRTLSAAALAIATLFSTSALADGRHYELAYPSGSAYPLFPGLDLQQLSSGQLESRQLDTNPQGQPTRLTLGFGKAGQLVATGFQRINDGYDPYDPYGGEPTYRALVEDAWVFREVVVELRYPALHDEAQVNIRVFVPEMSSRTAPLAEIHGPDLYQGQAMLDDVTPSYDVDVATAIAQDGKAVTLRLQNQVNVGTPGTDGFMVKTLWMGQGESAFYVQPYYGDPLRISPMGLELTSIPGPQGEQFELRIKYRDESGQVQFTDPQPLDALLSQAYASPDPML
ncbi:hypothetical protein [Gallaecimonas sp. GXIMD4217]|uniref:hypothetical protein n=1 Tax=Gallaecimonas sp. GXIMD4217 TaxID=3131927 RepID=UPI00311B2545